jgi:kynurenine formamidase
MENVKQSMLSRRSLFKGMAIAGAAVATGGIAKPVLAQQSPSKVVDLTHAYDGSFPTFDGNPGIEYEWAVEFAGNGYQLHKLAIFEHTGTHIDAPFHFSADGKSVDQIEPEQLVAPLAIIDITDRAKEDANATVEAADVEAWISANGELPAGAIVALRSGWAKKVSDPSFRNDSEGKFAFPGFAKSATDLLATLDVVHNSWLPGGRYGIECLNNLEELPVKGATIVVGAPKHKRGTGGPARVLALV